MINKIKSFISLLLFLAIGQLSKAQQDPQFSQYMFNTLIINPAYAGYREEPIVGVLSRNQWTGIEGAPKTQSLYFDTSLGQEKNTGLGISVVKDKQGLQEQTTGYLNYAYRLKVASHARLALGTGLGVGQYVFNGDQAITDDPNDPNISYNIDKYIVPDLRLGLHFSTDNFYAGFSATNLLGRVIDYGTASQNVVARQGRHFFLTAGTLVELSTKWKFKPSFLIKEDTKGPTNLDLNNFLLYNEKLWIGISYRTSLNLLGKGVEGNVKAADAIVAMVEMYEDRGWRIGYAYDFTLSSFSGYSKRSNEISISKTFGRRKYSILTPRYF